MTQDTPQTRTRVTRGLGTVLCVPGLPDAALPALLRYDAADPFAVRLVVLLAAVDEPDGPESVEWVFARSLLTEGLIAPAGEGDVRVRREERLVRVDLAGAASVLLPLDGLVEFLADSYQVVPTGGEAVAATDLEAGLVHLLG